MKRSCLDEETLAAYVDGLLPQMERTRVEEHLSACDLCLEEFVVAGSYLRGDHGSESVPAPVDLSRAALRLVNRQNDRWYRSLWFKAKRFLGDLWQKNPVHYLAGSGTGWQMSTVRGVGKAGFADLVHIHRSLDGLEADVEVERTGPRRAQIRVRLTSGNEDSKRLVRVTLDRDGREICSSLLKGGDLVFEDLRFGRYTLIFSRNGKTMDAYPFEIRETGRGR